MSVTKKRIGKICMLSALLSVSFLYGCRGIKENQNIENEQGESFIESEKTEPTEKNESDTIPVIYAQKEDDRKLADYLISLEEIPEEEQNVVRYYYNHIDLNGDGTEEIIAAVIRDADGKDNREDSVVVLSETTESYHLLGRFVSVRTPVMISDKTENGWNRIIFPVYGNGSGTGYRICVYNEKSGCYEDEEEDVVKEIDEYRIITQVLSNNLIDDMDKGNYLTLAP